MTTYSDFASKTRSDKLVLCHIEPQQRLILFTLDTGTVYKRATPHFVVGVFEDGNALTQASSTALNQSEFYYDINTSVLYIRTSDDSDPKTKTIVVTYRLFYANKPVDLPWDLATGDEVNYEGRLKSNSPISKELDDEQVGMTLEATTSVTFENNDGHFDEFYDILFFENKDIKLWSWSDTLALSEKQKLFDGEIQHKSFSDTRVSFRCKDFVYRLRQPVAGENFTASDGNIPERFLFTPKRRLFGQFKQLQTVPTDSVLDGFQLTGTVSGNSLTAIVTGMGTLFLDECSPKDSLFYKTELETIKLYIKTVDSDTQITLTEDIENSFNGITVQNETKRPWRKKNRTWHMAGHKLRSPSTTIIEANQENRFRVADSSDLFANDIIKVGSEDVFILRVSDDEVVLTSNLQGGLPLVGTSVTKSPVSKAYINGSEIFINRDWLITNTATNAYITLDDNAERNVAPIASIAHNLTFTNGSRNVTTSTVDLRAELEPRDWVRSDDITHTTWYEVLEVNENDLKLRVVYGGGTTTTNAQKKNVDLLDDTAIVTVDCMGQERSGNWIRTASDAVKDLLENDAGFTAINSESFNTADGETPFILSYAIPERLGANRPQIKQVINKINASVFGSLVQDSNFDLKYQVLSPDRDNTITQLKDDDLSSRNIRISSKNETKRKINAKFNPFTDKYTGDASFELYEFTNEFVDNYIGNTEELDITLYLFKEDDAKTIAQRYAFYNSLSQSVITISGKLNLALKVLNDKIMINFERLYKRFGNKDKRKVGIVNKVVNNGTDVTLEINDMGNAFNRSGVVSNDLVVDFASSDNDDKLFSSYVLDTSLEVPDINSDDEIFSGLIG